MSNTLFSNYARDKGWGMGKHVGAIPSAIGGRMIKLSHVGMVALRNVVNRDRWLGWIRHIVRDQVAVWMVCSFLGVCPSIGPGAAETELLVFWGANVLSINVLFHYRQPFSYPPW